LNNATLVPLDSNLTVTFKRAVMWQGLVRYHLRIKRRPSAEVTGGPTDFTLNPNYDLSG
jgi:hypothetical protein